MTDPWQPQQHPGGQPGSPQPGWQQPGPPGWQQPGTQPPPYAGHYGQPNGSVPPHDGSEGELPGPVNLATIFMFVALALNLVGVVLSAFNYETIMAQVTSAAPPEIPPEQFRSMLTVVLVVVLVIWLGVLGLLAWLTVMVRKGRNWARITVTVLIGVGVFFFLLGLLAPGPLLSMLVSVLLYGLLIAAVCLVWIPHSARAYFVPPARHPW